MRGKTERGGSGATEGHGEAAYHSPAFVTVRSMSVMPAAFIRSFRQLTGLVLVVFLSVPACAAGDAQQFTGRVVSVEDGDTLRVQRGQGDVRIRMFGIDAPEQGQPFGNEARDMLRALVLNKTVTVSMKDVDQYGRLVATLQVDGQDVGEQLLRAGAVWNYAQFSQDERFAALEAEARNARRGLWALDNPTPPWSFRSAARSGGPGGNTRRADGLLHGNTTSRVVHAPGCEHYTCRSCTATFETLDAARAAGYRPHGECMR